MEDDGVGIAGGIRCTGQRGNCSHSKALPRQLVSQESAIDHAVLDEKDANGVRLDEWPGRADRQPQNIWFKRRGHLKSLPVLAPLGHPGRLSSSTVRSSKG